MEKPRFEILPVCTALQRNDMKASDSPVYRRIARLMRSLRARVLSACLALSRHSAALRVVLDHGLRLTLGYRLLPLTPMSSASGIGAVLRPGHKVRTTAPAPSRTVAKSVEVDFPEIRYRVFRNAIVSADFSGLITDGQLVLPNDLYAQRNRMTGYGSLCSAYNERTALIPPNAPVPVNRGIFLGGNGSFNWYHWLIEILPKSVVFAQLPEELRDAPLLVPPEFETYPTYRQALRTMGLTNEIIVLRPRQAYRVEQAIFIDPPSLTPFNMRAGFWPELSDNAYFPEILTDFRNRILETLKLPERLPTRRIFLARTNTRRDYNQQALIEMFSELGVEPVYPDKLDFGAQVQLMRDAKLIIGPSGAAWATLLFAQEGTEGIIWTFPEYSELACYSNLAEIAGARLNYSFFPATPPPTTTHDLYSASYDVDMENLRETVMQMANPPAAPRASM